MALALPEGYRNVRMDRQNKVGGGIAIVLRDHIRITMLEQHSDLTMEVMVFRIEFSSQVNWRGALV